MQFLSFLLVLSCAIVVRSSTRILNGVEVSIADHPYVVSLQYRADHVCGGSILNDQWILTAGHCLLDRDLEFFKVAAGSNSLLRPASVYSVESVVIHEDFDASTWGPFQVDNIGLVQLSEIIHFSNNIKPIALLEQDITTKYHRLFANFVGWSIVPGVPATNKLRRADTILDTPEHCSEIALGFKNDIHICILDPKTDDLTLCPGDDGSPLVVNGVLVGIGLRYRFCKTYSIPLTYVWHYKNWIEGAIEKSSPKPIIRPTPPTAPTLPIHSTPPSNPLKYHFYASLFVNGTFELMSNNTKPDTLETI